MSTRSTRTRFQEGTLVIEGKTPCYYVRYRVYNEDGTSKQKKTLIGKVSALSKREANRLKSDIVIKETQQLPKPLSVTNRGDLLFKEFYFSRFIILKSNWSQAYKTGFEYIMNRFVLPKFGTIPIGQIDKVMVQSCLNFLSPKYSQSTIKHVKSKIHEVMEEAVEQEFITRNPVSKTRIPVDARSPEQPILTEKQLIGLIDGLKTSKDKAILMVGTFCAMRTSEVFGMPWKNFHHTRYTPEGSYFMVDQIAYRGQIFATTKTRSSKARVPIGTKTLHTLLEWRKECDDISENALIFPSTNRNGRSKVGAPMFPGIWLQKRVQPIAKELGVPFKVNFRALRRTAASMIQEHGGALATAQSLLRHASPSTTANVYSKPIPDSVKVAVNSYEDRVYAARPKPVLVK